MLKRVREDDLDTITKKRPIISLPMLELIESTQLQRTKYIRYIKNWLLDEYRIKGYILAGCPIVMRFRDMQDYDLKPDTFQSFVQHNNERIFALICTELPMHRFALKFDYRKEHTTISLDIL